MRRRRKRPLGPPDRLRPYLELLSAFVEHGMPAQEYERRYLDLYQYDKTEFSDDEFRVVDRLFIDVDDFVADPELYEPGTDAIGEAEFRRRATEALERLRELEARIER